MFVKLLLLELIHPTNEYLVIFLGKTTVLLVVPIIVLTVAKLLLCHMLFVIQINIACNSDVHQAHGIDLVRRVTAQHQTHAEHHQQHYLTITIPKTTTTMQFSFNVKSSRGLYVGTQSSSRQPKCVCVCTDFTTESAIC